MSYQGDGKSKESGIILDYDNQILRRSELRPNYECFLEEIKEEATDKIFFEDL